jgi:hypothetical protein
MVVESEVARISGHGRAAPSYGIDLRYRYEVLGRSYFGDRASFGRLSFGGGEGTAESLVRKYPAGSAVDVHYDPARPTKSVLQVGWTWSAVVRASLGLLVLIGVFILGGRRNAAA